MNKALQSIKTVLTNEKSAALCLPEDVSHDYIDKVKLSLLSLLKIVKLPIFVPKICVLFVLLFFIDYR